MNDTSIKATWFLRNAVLGTSVETFYGSPPATTYHPHEAFFCRHCGEIWLRIVRSYPSTYRPRDFPSWRCYEKDCPSHTREPETYSILPHLPETSPLNYLTTFSRELLLYEFNLLLKALPP